MSWPRVVDEQGTVKKLLRGYSIARFGDGECAIMCGGAQVREPRNTSLSRELTQVIKEPHKNCLIGIPTMNKEGAKYRNWVNRKQRFLKFLDQDKTYCSAFISRPDSAQWIRTPEYASLVESLWAGKRRVLVSERDVSIHRLLRRRTGEKLIHIECPHRETYKVLDQLETDIVKARPEIAVLSCGPAATCLANRLTHHGIQAIDLGSGGKFLLQELEKATAKLAVFALGIQRTGTTSLGSALYKAGYQVAHNRPKWLDDADYSGVLLTRAHKQGLDPIALMPGVEAIVHPSICILEPPINLWPQMDLSLLASLRSYHPECLFVLNKRPVKNWIRSIDRWKDFRERITNAEIPGLPSGVGLKDEDLVLWIGWHHNRMRDLFRDDPLYIEIDIEDAKNTEKLLSNILGRKINWPWLNRASL